MSLWAKYTATISSISGLVQNFQILDQVQSRLALRERRLGKFGKNWKAGDKNRFRPGQAPPKGEVHLHRACISTFDRVSK